MTGSTISTLTIPNHWISELIMREAHKEKADKHMALDGIEPWTYHRLTVDVITASYEIQSQHS